MAAAFVLFVGLRNLRSLPGVLSMCVVGVWFLAQAVLQFGAGQVGTTGLRVVLGILTHYLWLPATFWMNACVTFSSFLLMHPTQSQG